MTRRKSLAVVLGTYNRVELLRQCIAGARRSLDGAAVIHVTDAGSTDGTVEYLEANRSPTLIPHLVGRRIGQARALNAVFAQLDTDYVCWISDDNVLLDGALDRSVRILDRHRRIGLVALKVKDVEGPFVPAPYIGGISSIGILNVNQGMLPTALLKELGGFSEEYRDYGIDPDLTARVLFAGYRVVYTRKVCIHHYRQWATQADPEGQRMLQAKQAESLQIYERNYRHRIPPSRIHEMKLRLWKRIEPRLVAAITKGHDPLAAARHRDWNNVFRGRFISLLDPILTAGRDYHLVQKASVRRPQRAALRERTGLAIHSKTNQA